MSLRRCGIAFGMLLSMAVLSACIGTDVPYRGPVTVQGADTWVGPVPVPDTESGPVRDADLDPLPGPIDGGSGLDVGELEVGGDSGDEDVFVAPDGVGLEDISGPDVETSDGGADAEPVNAPVPAAAGDVVISEFMARSQSGTTDPGEYIELYNPTQATFHLKGCELVKTDTATNISMRIEENVFIGPGQYVVFARSAEAFGTLVADGYFTFQLVNTGESLALICGATTIDSLTYASSHVVLERSFQKSLNNLTGSNATMSDHWCVTPAEESFAYVPGKYGTPGAANLNCP